MSKNKTKLTYEVFTYLFNKEHGIVFIAKRSNPTLNIRIDETYNIHQLGCKGLELIQCVENRQTNGMIANRIAIFLYVD
jgi:hypothetical protein